MMNVKKLSSHSNFLYGGFKMKISDAILISRLAEMIYEKENMTAEEFYTCDIENLLYTYGIEEELIEYVIDDLCTYYN